MRFVWAVAAFVLAAVMIGAGIAQRTIFQGPKTSEAAIAVSEDAPYLLIDGSVLGALPGTQTLRAQADGDIFAAYGRTADIEAWLADTDYNSVTLDDEGQPSTAHLEPAEPEPTAPAEGGEETTAEADPAAETPARSPIGSDLWLDEFQQADVLIAPLQLPADMSVLVATDGTEPAPSTVSISWPIDNGTPWAGPLIVGGGILLAFGAFLYFLGIQHARRSRGPRRKGLPLPVTEPIDLAVEGADKGVISAGAPTRRSIERGRRAFVVLPAIAVSALLFAGCSADSWPTVGDSPTPSPTATVIVPEGQQMPAVTKGQAERILTRIAETTAEADEARDPALAANRLEGAVLAARETNYKLRGSIEGYATPQPILTKPLEIVLPQAYDGWPRSFMAVVDDSESKTSSVMIMTQADAWSPYKLSYQASLEAETLMPDLAAIYVGAPRIAPDSPFLILPPDQLGTAYADVVDKGDESEYVGLFESDGDQFRASITADRQARLDAFNQTATNTGSLTFAAVPGAQTPFAIGTLESGAIVAVNIDEVDTVKPTNADAVIKLPENETVKTLAGAEQSATGFTTTYSDQLFFYVPGQGSTEKIRLLGYGSAILDAKVIS
ncbi:MAG: glycosyl transferase [Microbacterium sp.]